MSDWPRDPVGRVLVATDLDGTIIYSERTADAPPDGSALRSVELIDGRAASFMTEVAARRFAALCALASVVAATARSPAQYARLELPGTRRFAVLANGGRILDRGAVDERWSATVAGNVRANAPFEQVWARMQDECDPGWTRRLRSVESLFGYAVVDVEQLPADFAAEQQAWAQRLGWRTSQQGAKFYWVPEGLTKSAAVAEIARRTGAHTVIAAGDSLLDAELLVGADFAVCPSHGELARAGWSAPHVERVAGVGVVGGEQMVDWLAAAVRRTRDGACGAGAGG